MQTLSEIKFLMGVHITQGHKFVMHFKSFDQFGMNIAYVTGVITVSDYAK